MIPLSDDPGQRHLFPFITISLIAINVLAFFYELSLSESQLGELFEAAGVTPYELTSGNDLVPFAPLGSVYVTLLTSMFLHSGFLHIGSNMLYLWVFGDNVEDAVGHLPYLVFYLLCGLVATLVHVAFSLGSSVPTIGASGAIAGALGAYIVLHPHALVRTAVFIGPFISFPRVSAYIVIGLWFVLQLLSGVLSLGAESEQSGGVAVWAHVGGFVAGFALIHAFRQRRDA